MPAADREFLKSNYPRYLSSGGKLGVFVDERLGHLGLSVRKLVPLVGLTHPTITERLESNRWLKREMLVFASALSLGLRRVSDKAVTLDSDGIEITCAVDDWISPDASRAGRKKQQDASNSEQSTAASATAKAPAKTRTISVSISDDISPKNQPELLQALALLFEISDEFKLVRVRSTNT